MTTMTSPANIKTSIGLIKNYAEETKRPLTDKFEVCLYHSINVNENPSIALAEAKQYLLSYYGTEFPDEYVKNRAAVGDPQACIDRLWDFFNAGVTTIILRLAGADQRRQFERVSEAVLPAL